MNKQQGIAGYMMPSERLFPWLLQMSIVAGSNIVAQGNSLASNSCRRTLTEMSESGWQAVWIPGSVFYISPAMAVCIFLKLENWMS